MPKFEIGSRFIHSFFIKLKIRKLIHAENDLREELAAAETRHRFSLIYSAKKEKSECSQLL